MEEIRTLKPEEWDESMRLSSFAFQYELSPQEMEERKRLAKTENMWGYFIEGKLAAKLTILPFYTLIQGRRFAMGGVASVATWPEYRRKGLVAQLLVNALRVMKEEGQTISFLSPFSFPFYRKFGWETFMELKKYEVGAALLPKHFVEEGYIVREEKDWARFNALYEPYASGYSGMLQRVEDWWINKVFKNKKGQAAMVYDSQGTPKGYVLYEVKAQEMNIHEMVFLDEQARKGLWKFISNHDSMIDKVKLIAPADDQLPFLLDNPRIKQEIEPCFMARIIDAAAFLEQYPFLQAEKTEAFVLRLEDEHAPWNNGTFQLEVMDGKAVVREKVEVESVGSKVGGFSEAATLSCSIQTLTTMLIGYQKPSLLHKIGRLQGEAAEVQRWQQLVPSKTPFLMDSF